MNPSYKALDPKLPPRIHKEWRSRGEALESLGFGFQGYIDFSVGCLGLLRLFCYIHGLWVIVKGALGFI